MESWSVRTSIAAVINGLIDRDYCRALAAARTLRGDTAANPDGMSWGQATESIFRAACPNLDSLAAALNGLEAAALEAEERPRSWGWGKYLPLDTTSLPLYGDEDADLGLDGAFSWDERRALVPENPSTGATEWTVVPRWDLPEADND